jgi:hypothetical protein
VNQPAPSKKANAESGLSRDAVARMFARLTADRDQLRAAIDRCEHRLDELARALGQGETAPAHEGCQGSRALAVAEEALAAARAALSLSRDDVTR